MKKTTNHNSWRIILLICLIISPINAFAANPFARKIDTIRSVDEFSRMAKELLFDKSLSNSNIGIEVYSLKNKKPIFSYNSNKELIPASVSKIFTSFMALKILGASGTLNTTIYTDAKEVKPQLEGNIYIFGRGDALLSVTDLEKLVADIQLMGIRSIKGNIYADGSFFDENMYRFHYSGDDDEVEYVPPVSALSLDRNTATIIVSAGSSAGRPANVQVLPTSAGFSTSVNAKVRGYAAPVKKKRTKSRSENNAPELDDMYYGSDPNAQNYGDFAMAKPRSKKKSRSTPSRAVKPTLSVYSSDNVDGCQNISVNGLISANTRSTHYIAMTSPCLVVAGALLERLKTAGITVSGKLLKKKISSLEDSKHITVLAEFRRPLGNILSNLNKNSDNYLAENVFKMVGACYGNRLNNKQGAIDYYKIMFDSLHFPKVDNQFNDGSGLSRRNKTSASTIAYLLENAKLSEIGTVLDTSLSKAGRDGTLRKRFIGTAAENNLSGKTGTHRNVSALAGYVRTYDDDTLCFAIVSNGWSVGQYKLLENALGEMMANLKLDE